MAIRAIVILLMCLLGVLPAKAQMGIFYWYMSLLNPSSPVQPYYNGFGSSGEEKAKDIPYHKKYPRSEITQKEIERRCRENNSDQFRIAGEYIDCSLRSPN